MQWTDLALLLGLATAQPPNATLSPPGPGNMTLPAGPPTGAQLYATPASVLTSAIVLTTTLLPSAAPTQTAVSEQPPAASTSMPGAAPTAPCNPLSYQLDVFMASPQNYSSVFQLTPPRTANDTALVDAACDVNRFCASRAPGLYCYRPTALDCVPANVNISTCMPVAMVSCPEGVFFGCSDGYGCHQEGEPWPWSAPMALTPGDVVPGGYYGGGGAIQPQPSDFVPYYVPAPLQGNVSASQALLRPSAHCYTVPRSFPTATPTEQAFALPTEPADLYQWCQYRGKLLQAKAELLVSDCVTQTKAYLETKSAGQPTCTASVATYWWWPGIETGAAPTVWDTASASATSSASQDPCLPTPPPLCPGPYPQAKVPTRSYVFISTVAPTSVPTVLSTQTTTESGATMTQTQTQTQTETQIQTQVQTQTQTQIQTSLAVVTVTTGGAAEPGAAAPPAAPVPAPAAPTPAEPAGAAPAVSIPVQVSLGGTIGAKVPQALFPSAGEPYAQYQSKIAAIGTTAVAG